LAATEGRPGRTAIGLFISFSSPRNKVLPVNARKPSSPTFPAAPRATLEAVEQRLLFTGGTLSGVAWSDVDGDGRLESGEPLLANWTIYLDANHNARLDAGEVTTPTDASGAYRFSNLPAGNYLIGAVPRPGYRQTFPSATAQPAALAASSPLTDSAVSTSITRVADRSNYTAAELESATGWVVGLKPGTTVASVVSRSGAKGSAATGLLPNTYVLMFPGSVTGAQASDRLAKLAGLSFSYPLIARQQQSRFIPNDPLFNQEWHLRNTGQRGGTPGADVNVTPAWDINQGFGVTVGVVDDGVQYTHPDLSANYDSADSFDFDDNDSNPSPNLSRDDHGTRVAGVIAARGNNGIGVSGAAPQAKFAALRLTDRDTVDQEEAAALAYHRDKIAIYSNSWGPEDEGTRLEGPGPLTIAAIRDSVLNGRGGKGSVYVWAAGNGLEQNDNTNYDGYANSRYVIAATALDAFGNQAYYAEPGSPILVATYGAGDDPGITTTDLTGSFGADPGNYDSNFGGTSASAPLVSGVVALMLGANPNLTWRDVKQILLNTARKNDPIDEDWVRNGAGHWVNHKYGFGSVDAAAAVRAAATWVNLPPETSVTSGTVTVNRDIPDDDMTGVSSSVTIDRLLKVETVEVVLDLTHPFRGDLRVVLTSPDGTKSVLATPHADGGDGYHWTFSSTHHWDEIAKGKWTLTVTDERYGDVGTLSSWKLDLYGTNVTTEQYATLAAGETVAGLNFGFQGLPGPRVSTSAFPLDAAPQRLAFTFDRDVAPNIAAGALEVRNDTTGQLLAAAAQKVEYNAGTRTAVWTFMIPPGANLPDGNYTARLKAELVSASANGGMLDGNNDGAGGDDFVTHFFQLTGDANRDRAVDTGDFKIVFKNLNRIETGDGPTTPATWADGDFNHDGRVDFQDFQTFELAFGHKLPAPAAGASAAAPAPIPSKPAAAPAKPSPVKPIPIPPPPFASRPIRRRDLDLFRA
jgi:subtilisin-like proprotein convertase family protein